MAKANPKPPVTKFESFRGLHHLVDIFTDLVRIGPHTYWCKFCQREIPSGLTNISAHFDECPEHPVFVSDGFDWGKMEPTGQEMTYGEYLKSKTSGQVNRT